MPFRVFTVGFFKQSEPILKFQCFLEKANDNYENNT